MLNYMLGLLGGVLGGAGEAGEGSVLEQLSKVLDALMKAPLEDSLP